MQLMRENVWLVAKGYTQVEGEDYIEIFALVAKITIDRNYTRWALVTPSSMGMLKKRFTWRDLKTIRFHMKDSYVN
ncbi:hypothetical protein CR513_02246, partial [Mucuna pruriens]